MDRRDWTALDNTDERLALSAVELGRPSRRLAIDETVRPPGIEPQRPVADCLQTDTTNARRLPTRAGVVNLGKRQEAPALIRVLFANPRNANASKSSRNAIGAAMANLLRLPC